MTRTNFWLPALLRNALCAQALTASCDRQAASVLQRRSHKGNRHHACALRLRRCLRAKLGRPPGTTAAKRRRVYPAAETRPPLHVANALAAKKASLGASDAPRSCSAADLSQRQAPRAARPRLWGRPLLAPDPSSNQHTGPGGGR